MATTLENTGERMIPEHHKGRNMYGAHIGRYQAGVSLVKDKVVLDIACGSGYGTKMMAESAKRVIGVDVDKATVEYAEENYGGKNITYLQGDGTKIPLEDASVDVVVSYETIEHIEDYKTFMAEVKRVMKPNGMLLLSTPNDVEYGEGNHYHVHEFTYTELKNLVKKYFKHQKSYFQTLWLYSSIVSEEMQTKEWEQDVKTTNTIPLKPEQCIYFFLLCSDQPIKEEIKPLGVIGEHYRQRDMQALGENHRKTREALEKLQERAKDLSEKNAKLTRDLDAIGSAKAWKVAKALQRIAHPLKGRSKRSKK